MQPPKTESFWAIARHRSVTLRAGRIALVVGSVLAVINHGDRLITGTIDNTVAFKILLTFLVPYCVSTYSSVAAVRDRAQTLPDAT